MKLALLAAASVSLIQLPNLAGACADHAAYAAHVARNNYARQATSTPPASGSTSAPPGTSTASGTAATTSSVNGTATGNATSSATQISVSLISTNPTAIPLANITASQVSSPTIALPTTFAAGATPSAISNAPPLPDISGLNPANYPPMDKPPPTDSPEVQGWINDVMNSGFSIPNISQTTGTAACAANPEAAADQSRCWWTCGGCTRDTDITACPDQLTWGLTHDDGPGFYTPNLLQYLDEKQLKTTFFTIGSRILEEPHTLQTEYMSGHQIGVHTWSHPPLTTLSNEEIIAEFGWTKKITKDILGVTPNTFRPPFGDIDDRVRAIALAMDLTPIIWTRISPSATFDTGDFSIPAGTISSSQVIQNFNQIMGNATTINTGFIVLEHDLFEQTVELATGYILPEALAHQPPFKIEPVITCLGKSLSDAYVETNDNSTNPPPSGSEFRLSAADLVFYF
ncbi:glycoside hydrolase/deacetylase [Fomitiporia mediterranea MF3/22]|uniref:glycoside hydrolase/deacetylase n=1 Tax=Fomitiporia mediterranea (strain MF3/22) TaxID=694068 RepID=UPI0004407AD7|nr:glycoside hydrolase/deacetylase [Fomitiporia mediterranea MF3/22]EJD04398.1 glycoside hydrolase/deacetylase [Fomitiporia mediterranea MF3/22]